MEDGQQYHQLGGDAPQLTVRCCCSHLLTRAILTGAIF